MPFVMTVTRVVANVCSPLFYCEGLSRQLRLINRLRKAACRRLAEAGCTAHQIAAIGGHLTLRGVERYT